MNATVSSTDGGAASGTFAERAFNTARLKQKASQHGLMPLLIAGAAAIALIAALLLWASAPEYRVLFSNLAEADGGRIISELDTRRVPYKFSDNGRAILVPSDHVHALRLQLAEQGLPQGGTVGLELLDNQSFGTSQFAEQVHFQRGLEGELVRSIKTLGPVADARVHLALPKPTVFVREREPAKASVVLTLHPGRALGGGQVASIKHLVSSSVAGLAVDDVTVIDQHGVLLSGHVAESDVDTASLAFTKDLERSYQARIENILLPLFGPRNVRVEVAAQVDFSRREETAERYGPNQSPDRAAVRSAQRSTSYNGSDDIARGIPGALSNTVPGVAASPITAEDGDSEHSEVASTHNESLINYEVDRNITHIQHHRGQLQRLSVAAVVNYREGLDEDGNPARLPLDAQQLEQVERLTRQAMGFSRERGDALEVVNSPFTDDYTPDETAPLWWTSTDTLSLFSGLGRFLLVGILALTLYLLIVRPLLRNYLAASQPASPDTDDNVNTPPSGSRPEEEEDDHDQEPALARRSQRYKRKLNSQEQRLEVLRDTARDDPRLLAIVIRNWMSRNE